MEPPAPQPPASVSPAAPPDAPPGLEYATAHAGRPGLVTAIGVMSVVVGSAGILGAALQGMVVVTMFFTMVAMSKFTASLPPAPQNTTTAPAGAIGLSGIQRPAVANVLSSMRKMTTEQYMQLDSLLDTCGENIFPGLSPSDPTAGVEAAVVKTGATPATQPSSSPGVFFITGTGRIDVDDDGATFTPADGSAPIHASADTSPGVATAYAPAPATAPAPPVPYVPFIGAAAQCAVNLGLAIFLFVLGIMTLRHSARAGRLHLIYCKLKIPLCIAGAAALVWFVLSMVHFADTSGSAPSVIAGVVAYVAGFMLLGLAYPIGLLIALRARSVRAYYQSITE